jgi:nicotinate-nucleotide adenylyltransferase
VSKVVKYKAKIGLLGGTFDPVHTGHLILADMVRDELALEKVLFVPSHNPPHKANKAVSASIHRHQMLSIAIKNMPGCGISDIELCREGYTFTVDTMQQFAASMPEAELYFIIGSDILADLPRWKDFRTLAALTRFAVVHRNQEKQEDVIRTIEHLEREYGAKMTLLQLPVLLVSSSEIRLRLHEGRSVRHLLPESVLEYIKEHRLYE